METGFLLLCDGAEALNGKIYSLGAGWNGLRFPELPATWAFAIGIGIDIDWNETNRRHTLELHIEDPDGQVLGETFSLDFEAGRPPGTVQGQDQRIVMAVNTQHEFTKAGPHSVVLKGNGKEIPAGRSRFYVAELGKRATLQQ